jgi:hypothetical protein
VSEELPWIAAGPRTPFNGRYNYGDIVWDEKCPSCGKQVLYNGNYFCEDWGYTSSDDGTRRLGPCDWALGHPATSKKDREFCRRQHLDYE